MGVLFDAATLLTPRQLEIVRFAYRHYTEEELCRVLDITPRTLRWHSTQIRKVFPRFRIQPCDAPNLTEREREVAALVADGLCNRAISKRLQLSLSTVAQYLQALYQKTGCENRVQLALNTLIVQNRITIGATEAVKA